MISIDNKLIEQESYGVLKFKERFELKKVVHNYCFKKDEEKILQSLKEYIVTQHIIYNRIKETEENYPSLLYATYFSTLCALETLNCNDEENTSFFKDKKIDFKKKFPSSTNDSLEILIRTIEETHPIPYLEPLTSSFLSWLCISSLEEISDIKKEDHPKIEIKKKQYQIDFSILSKKEIKKTNFDLSKYSSQQPEKKEIKKTNGNAQYHLPLPTEEKSFSSETFIHGHDNVKKEFKKITTIINDREYFTKLLPAKELFHNYLLVGPSGTGKTTLINTLAQQCGLEFRSIPCADLCSKYFGESAANIQEIYAQAKQLIEKDNASGVILFFDEFDQIAGARGNSPNDRERNSLVTTLNTNLDGTNSTAGILTFAATNVEQIIDPALLTRFQKLYVGYPETDEALIAMHQTIIKKIEHYAKQHNPNQTLFDNIDYSTILPFSQTDQRYKSGRIINRILQNTALEKVLTSYPSPPSLITTKDLVQEYKKYNLELGKKYSLTNEPGIRSVTI